MEFDDALARLRHLASGVDPLTGEHLSPAHPLNRPDLIRTFYTLLHGFEQSARQEPQGSARARPSNAGKPWNSQDDLALAQAASGGADIAELMRQFGRSRAAIKLRLEHVGLPPEGEPDAPAEQSTAPG